VLANTDQDGCLDGPEYLSGTNPRIKDSIVDDKDGDCLSDEIEKQLGTDLSNRDSDRDKLSDSLEVALGLNPLDVDTDFDGIFDWKQVELLYSN
jgi:cobalamin biosynthesis protein CbiG